MSSDNDYAIGIDLGTTNSCVSVWKNNRVEILANEFSNRITPSCVAFTDKERLIGEVAKSQFLTNRENTIINVKRLMGYTYNSFKKKFNSDIFSYELVDKNSFIGIKVKYQNKDLILQPEEVSSIIIQKMKEVAEKYLGCEVKKAVITVPAYFNESQRQSTKNAGKIAGLNVLRIINEPTAAALAYGFNELDPSKKQNILVYDFGGGTLDCSILTISDGIFNVRSTSGDTYLGGENINDVLVKYCIQEFKKNTKINLKTVKNGSKAISKLAYECERVKKILSINKTSQINIENLYANKKFEIKITQSKFESLCRKIFKKAFEPVLIALDESCLKKEEINKIVLVGGSSRIPKIQSMLQDYFGDKLCFGINADEAVATGAAIQAALLNNQRLTKMNNILLLDVLPLSLGIETSGGVLTKILSRNTKLPCKSTQIYSTAVDNQPGLTIKIFQGERTLTVDNHKLGEFNFLGIPPMKRAVPRIEITFEVDMDGILNVKALETTTNKHKEYTIIDNNTKLTDKQINYMIEQAKKFKKIDNELLDLIESKNRLENLVYHIKNQIEDNALDQQLEQEDLDLLQDKSNNTLEWLYQNQEEENDVYRQKYDELELEFKNILSRQLLSSNLVAESFISI
jgi:heat shock 70kDa protein 1/2/6/8